MRTTIEMPDELLEKAKAQADKQGLSLKMFFIDAVQAKLAPPAKGRRKPPVVGRRGDPIVRMVTGEALDEAILG